jgi:hypothetical protein
MIKKIVCISIIFLLTITSFSTVGISKNITNNQQKESTENIVPCSNGRTASVSGHVYEGILLTPGNCLNGVKVERVEYKVPGFPIFGYNVLDSFTTRSSGQYILDDIPVSLLNQVIIRFSKPGYVTKKVYLMMALPTEYTYNCQLRPSLGKFKAMNFIDNNLFKNFPLLEQLFNI